MIIFRALFPLPVMLLPAIFAPLSASAADNEQTMVVTASPGGDGLVLHGFTLARISRDAQIVAGAQRPLIIQARLGLTDGFARIVLLATWRLTRIVTPFAV